MDGVELAYAGIARQAELIAAGEVSSRELVELYLQRIGRYDPKLNSFRVVFAERALLEADQADARRAASAASPQGGTGRALLGVPIAVKDDIDVAGEVTAWGTNARETPAAADAEVVRRLREAGAVIIGKTNVPEMTLWPFTETSTFGVTRNPWDLQHTPGGSSGGSGAAVAAGLVGAALGSDGGGSIRVPAAWCGLVGLKPQRGRVSLAPRPRAWHGLSVDGVLTRRVSDTALFHDVVSGSTDIDVDRPDSPQVPFSQAAAMPPGRLRIAWSTKFPGLVLAKLDEEVRRALAETVELLGSLGHELRERDPDYGNDAIPSFLARYMRGAHDDVAGLEYPGRLERRTRAFARIGGLISDGLLERTFAGEAALSARINSIFAEHDLLITPAVARPAPPIGALQGRGALMTLNAVAGWVPYNGVWNLTGQPALAVPAGLSSEGLPLSVQIVAPAGQEGPLLSLAAQLEAERPWPERRPPGFE
jgi:amidase